MNFVAKLSCQVLNPPAARTAAMHSQCLATVLLQRCIGWSTCLNLFMTRSVWCVTGLCLTMQVPDGYKMVVSAAPAGGLRRALFPLHKRRPSWQWDYQMDAHGCVKLSILETARPPTYAPAFLGPPAEAPFVYVI